MNSNMTLLCTQTQHNYRHTSVLKIALLISKVLRLKSRVREFCIYGLQFPLVRTFKQYLSSRILFKETRKPFRFIVL
jgi:hypothetical protein